MKGPCRPAPSATTNTPHTRGRERARERERGKREGEREKRHVCMKGVSGREERGGELEREAGRERESNRGQERGGR